MNARVCLLAAGNGRRAGGPKAWQTREGKTLLESHLGSLLSRFPAEKISISIQEPWRERCLGLDPEVSWTAVNPEAAPLQSLQTLLGAAPLSDWAFVHHVDMALWGDDLFKALCAAAQTGPEAIVPTYQGKRGHPVLLSRAAQTQVLALNPKTDRLDSWLRTAKVSTVELPFPCILENLNEPIHA